MELKLKDENQNRKLGIQLNRKNETKRDGGRAKAEAAWRPAGSSPTRGCELESVREERVKRERGRRVGEGEREREEKPPSRSSPFILLVVADLTVPSRRIDGARLRSHRECARAKSLAAAGHAFHLNLNSCCR